MQRMTSGFILTMTALALLVAGISSGAAQQPPRPALPDAYKMNMMIRNTIIALNQANMTGNYSVLRDLAAPDFQRSNNQVRLAQIFAELRAKSFDLSPVFFISPLLVRDPIIDPNGYLHLSGYFPSRPRQVTFDMMFQFVEGQWQVLGLAIDTRPSPEEAAPPPAPPPAPMAAKLAPPVNPAPPAPAHSAVSKKSDLDRSPASYGGAEPRQAALQPKPSANSGAETPERQGAARQKPAATRPAGGPEKPFTWKTEPEKPKAEAPAVSTVVSPDDSNVSVRIDFENVK
jgi:hypothetical protein